MARRPGASYPLQPDKGETPWQPSSPRLSLPNRVSRAFEATTKRAAALKSSAKKLGVKVTDIYWTLGEYDGVLIFEAPDDETATGMLLQLGAMGNVQTTTCRAFTAAEMDQILSKVNAR